MGGLRTDVERLTRLLPDPEGVAAGYVVTTYSYTDERGITQYGYLLSPGGGGGSGTVTSFSAGDLSPLFTSGVTNPTTTPALAFTQIAQAANRIFAGPTSGGSANPTFRALVAADIPSLPYGTGTVTSVGLSLPAEFAVSGSPVTTTGTLTGTKATQSANTVWAGPTSGGVAQPAFRALVAADLPSNVTKRGPGCVFTNGGLVLSGTLASEIEVQYGFTGTGYTIVADATGSASIVVQHSTYAGYDTMSTLFTATLSSAKKNQASVSFSLAAGDILRFSGSSFSGATRLSIQLDGSPT